MSTPPNSPPVLSIVIVNWRSYELLDKCLSSLEDAGLSIAFEVIVVDNSSDARRRTELSAEHTRMMRWVVNDSNVGYAAANNAGMKSAAGKYFLLLNPDTVVEPAAIPQLLHAIETDPKLGILGAHLVNEDGSGQTSSYALYPSLLGAALDAFGVLYVARLVRPPEQNAAPRAVAWVKGACLLIRRATYADIGDLDSNFFMYCEDADWCFRARVAGWKVATLDIARVVHLGQGSARSNYAASVSAYYAAYERFVVKHYGAGMLDLRLRLLHLSLSVAALSRLVALTLIGLVFRSGSMDLRVGYLSYLRVGHLKVNQRPQVQSQLGGEDSQSI